MTENLLAELAQLTARTRQLQSLVPQVQGDGPFSGSDPDGAVSAEVDRDGTLTKVEVDTDWKSLISPDALGAAVRGAVVAAGAARMGFEAPTREDLAKDWSQVELTGELPEATPTPEDEEAVAEQVKAQRQVLDDAASRMTMAEAEESFLTQLDRLREVTSVLAEPGADTELVSENRMIRLTLSPFGQVTDCHVESRWADRQSGRALSMAFGELLAQRS
ncbi:hypothetical protein ACQBAU_03755 [Propionibacteriaceae bacterium Y2011]